SADDSAVILRSLAVIAEQPQAISQLRVVGGHHSTVAKAAQILRWIKTESTKMPNRPGASPLILRADGLRRILDDIKVVTIGALRLQRFDLWSEDEVLRVGNAIDRCAQLFPNSAVLRL